MLLQKELVKVKEGHVRGLRLRKGARVRGFGGPSPLPKGPVDDERSRDHLQLQQHDRVVVRHRDQLHCHHVALVGARGLLIRNQRRGDRLLGRALGAVGGRDEDPVLGAGVALRRLE